MLIHVIERGPRGHAYWYGLTVIPAWISNNTYHEMWDEITYPFSNFNGAAVEFLLLGMEINYFIPHFLGVWLIIHPGTKVNPC